MINPKKAYKVFIFGGSFVKISTWGGFPIFDVSLISETFSLKLLSYLLNDIELSNIYSPIEIENELFDPNFEIGIFYSVHIDG